MMINSNEMRHWMDSHLLFLPQCPRPPTVPPSPWRPRARCTSPGSRGPTADPPSRRSGWSTGAAAAQSGSWRPITSRRSSCRWKFATWSPVSEDTVQDSAPQPSGAGPDASALIGERGRKQSRMKLVFIAYLCYLYLFIYFC